MRMINSHFLTVLLGVVFGVSAPLWASSSQLINGAGASFPYPLYSMWFKTYHTQNPNVKINYQSIGSGGGIRQVLAKTVDFGATDSPMKSEDLSKAGYKIYHIPTALGGVALTYNLPNYTHDLKLTPELIVEIYTGNIKKWNDPRLVELNPELKNIKNYVIPIRRSDGSGTTAVFTEYLSKVSSYWKENFGSAKAIKWPSAIGGKGNEGVTGLIRQNPGAIGYVEVTFAYATKMPVSFLKNNSGKFIKPTMESISAAAQNVEIPSDFRVSITNSLNPEAYPIASFTYLLVPEIMTDKKSEMFRKFLRWSMKEGQNMALSLNYAKLPSDLVQKVNTTVEGIQFRSK